MKTFSIITPIYSYNEQKSQELYRCIESIKHQIYNKDLIEHIIINDGSIVQLKIPDYRWIKVINQPNLQRITAYNEGFKKAKNDIFWMLDADDELVPEALSVINVYWETYPKYKMFNFGCFYVHKDGVITKRGVFQPKEKRKGHEVFGGGNIVNGTYVFNKDIYKKLGAFPENEIKNIDCSSLNYGGVRNLCMSSPYDFSAWFQLEFPETQQYFMVDHENEKNKIIKEIGNPWGQDYALFYKYLRTYLCMPIPLLLERVYVR